MLRAVSESSSHWLPLSYKRLSTGQQRRVHSGSGHAEGLPRAAPIGAMVRAAAGATAASLLANVNYVMLLLEREDPCAQLANLGNGIRS